MNVPTCACGYASTEGKAEATDTGAACCPEAEGKICCVKVLGAGCESCQALFENTKEAVRKLNLSVDVEYVTDMQEVMKYGVMSLPALVVNEKVVAMGKVYKAADVEKILHKLEV